MALGVTLTTNQLASVEYVRPVCFANPAADSPLRSNSSKIRRRCSWDVRTRPRVSSVTGTLGMFEEATAGTVSDRFVVVITPIFMTSIRDRSRGGSPDAYLAAILSAIALATAEASAKAEALAKVDDKSPPHIQFAASMASTHLAKTFLQCQK